MATEHAPPTRVALLSDIHGDLVALEAVLADIAAQGVEDPQRIVCLGDIALSGPQPHECVARIRALGCPTVMGNCDELALRLRSEGPTPELMGNYAGFGAWVADLDLWSAQALTDADAAWLGALPLTATLALGPAGSSATLLCAHGSPQSFNHRLLADAAAQPDTQLAERVGPVTATALASGHTHLPMLRRLGVLTIVNPGSVGLPIVVSAEGLRNADDYAEYGLLTWDEGAAALRWEPRRAAVDGAAARASALASGMPHADRWRSDWTRP